MAGLVISVLWILVTICVLVGLYYVALWVFSQLGIPVPEKAMKIVFVILTLLVLIWLVTVLFGGGPMPFRIIGPG